MNLEAFLREAEAPGLKDSRGEFTVTLSGLLDRLGKSLLVDPGHAPLAVVAAAVGAGAKALEVKASKKELVFEFSMDEPLMTEVGQKWQELLQTGATRHLLIATAVWRQGSRKVSLIFPGQGRQLILTPSSVAFEPWTGREEGGWVRLVVTGKVPSRDAVELALLRHCGLCPIPLSMHKTPLQRPLTAAYAGRSCAWSSGVPEHLRPEGPAQLNSELAVLLAETQQARPQWVAVVGGTSYPFLLPEAEEKEGIVWSSELRTDLSMTALVCDDAWSATRAELLRLAKSSGARRNPKSCTTCGPGLGGSVPKQPCAVLSQRLHGRVLTPRDPGYAAQVAGFNTAYHHRPSLVVAASDAADVVETVIYARQHGYRIAVQATGHGVHQPIEAVILISTRRLDKVAVDGDARTVTIGAGVRWKAVLAAAAEHGLAPVAGSSPDVGVVGYLLGGGLGPLARSHGFGSDYLEELTVVTGTGRLVRANARENSDLFWALRGGKVGLGVVTEARLRLVELSKFYGGCLDFYGDGIEAALRGWIAWTETAHPLVSTSMAIIKAPARSWLYLRLVFPGEGSDETGVSAPLLALSDSFVGKLDTRPATDLATLYNDPRESGPFWVSGLLLSHLDQDFAGTLLAELERDDSLRSVEIRHLGQATHRDVPEGSAVGGRAAKFTAGFARTRDPSMFETQHPRSDQQLRETLAPWTSPETNINFAAKIRSPEHFASAWPEPIGSRLKQVRQRYDPDGLLR